MPRKQQAVRHIAILISLPLITAGCDNSKKTAAARCALEAAKINPTDARPSYTWNCMRVAGYEFYGGLCGGIYSRPDDAACYVPVSTLARLNDSIDRALGF
jgi:hypothetical protein